MGLCSLLFFFSSRRRHTRLQGDWSSDVCSSDLIAGAGAVEAIASVQAILTGKIPPTINYENPDPACDLHYVPNRAIESTVDVVLSNSFGFGGHNSSLALSSVE